ncbi:MAG: acyltransferase, partial [Prevotella sp.]|nr:acyltransferase [Prevotella sp.]
MDAISSTNRNIGVDILKCFAAILITNSHMDFLYVKYSALATGGSLGDVLFFFVSGFALFMKPSQRTGHDFANWYKRRINRIYPTIFAIAIIRCLLVGSNANIIEIILYGGGWFCSCIMIYYIFVYQIVTRKSGGVNLYMLLTILLSVIWFFLLERPIGYNMYKPVPEFTGNVKYLIYFLYMLLGAKVGMSEKPRLSPVKDTIMLFVSIFLFYALYILPRKFYVIEWLQIANIIPQMGVCYYMYKVSIG